MSSGPRPSGPVLGEAREVAVPRLLEQFGGRIYALASRLCRKPEDAEDLVQEIFLQAYRNWEQFDGRSSPTTWLFTIAVRACQRLHRKRAGQPARMESLDKLLPFADTRMAALPAGAGGERGDEATRRESVERLENAIAQLPPAFRLPLVLKDIIGLPVAEVAAALGLKAATVKTRLHRARLRVHRELTRKLPKRTAPPVAYSKQVCLDLLRAKQDALDRGVPLKVRGQILCERCRTVFAALDWTHELCGHLAQGELPPALRQRLSAVLRGA